MKPFDYAAARRFLTLIHDNERWLICLLRSASAYQNDTRNHLTHRMAAASIAVQARWQLDRLGSEKTWVLYPVPVELRGVR